MEGEDPYKAKLTTPVLKSKYQARVGKTMSEHTKRKFKFELGAKVTGKAGRQIHWVQKSEVSI